MGRTITFVSLGVVGALALGACGGVEPTLEPVSAEYAEGTQGREAALLPPEGIAHRPFRVQEVLQVPATVPAHRLPGGVRPEMWPCPMGLMACDGECVNLGLDPDHCGGCNRPCATADCVDGHCVAWPTP